MRPSDNGDRRAHARDKKSLRMLDLEVLGGVVAVSVIVATRVDVWPHQSPPDMTHVFLSHHGVLGTGATNPAPTDNPTPCAVGAIWCGRSP